MKRPSLHVALCCVALICMSALYLTYRYVSNETFSLRPSPQPFRISTSSTVPSVSSKEIELDVDKDIVPVPLDISQTEPPVMPTLAMSEVMKGPLAQDDPKILSYIMNNGFLVPPSTAPYNLTGKPNKDPSMGQSRIVRKIFQYMKNGFFVECGALDGEIRSNTLLLERDFGWEGLLIEGDPKNVELVIQKNRKAWVAKACLATKSYPHEVLFKQRFNMGKIVSTKRNANLSSNKDEASGGVVRVQCFPLFSLLSALNVTVVDYLSLDVEGNEFQVLQTIPFDKVQIKVLSVEYIHSKGGATKIENFMKNRGYRVVSKVTNRGMLANDIILVHESVDLEGTIKPIHT